MEKARETRGRKLRFWESAIGIALTYLFFSVLWIFGTGQLLGTSGLPHNLERFLETAKGIFFVVITSTLIFVLVHRSITRMRKANELLQESAQKQDTLMRDIRMSENYHRGVVQNMGNAYSLMRVLKNDDGVVEDFLLLDANVPYSEFMGKPLADLLGKRLSEILPPDRFLAAPWGDMVREAIRSGRPGRLSRYQALNGRWYSMLAYVPAEDELVMILSDINDLVLQQEGMQQTNQALLDYQKSVIQLLYQDDWTGLPNRRALREYLASYITYGNGSPLTLAYVDLDNFKYINDTKGHMFGDLFIKAVAERMQSMKPKGWLIYRMGGDEFIMCFPGRKSRSEIDDCCRMVQDVFAEPLDTGIGTMFGSASIGVACYPDDTENADDLLRYADIAMYRSKQGGRKGFTLFEHHMIDPISRRLILEDGLRTATLNNEFELVYQPQLDMATGRITGFEALLRWRHPEIGMISPAEFIPVAEESRHILEMGEWVIRSACTFLKRLHDTGYVHLNIALNLSMLQLLQDDFFATATRIVQESGLEPHNVELEITETILMDAQSRVLPVLKSLRAAGFTLALDDFGKGYSSLSYLMSMPLSLLKIDKSFVDELETDSPGRTVLGKILDLGHALGLRVVAEGVETLTQKKILEQLGCDVLQGYWFSRPLRGDDAMQLAREMDRP